MFVKGRWAEPCAMLPIAFFAFYFAFFRCSCACSRLNCCQLSKILYFLRKMDTLEYIFCRSKMKSHLVWPTERNDRGLGLLLEDELLACGGEGTPSTIWILDFKTQIALTIGVARKGCGGGKLTSNPFLLISQKSSPGNQYFYK